MNLLQLKSLSGKEGNAWHFSFLLLFLWIVAGCNNMPEEMPAMSGDELRLGMGIRTRASDTAFERMDQIGLYAVQWPDDATSGVLLPSGNYTNNTCFTLLDPSQDWRGVPPVYYPLDNRKLDIYAYYPYRENAFLPGTTSIGLSVQPNQSVYANYTFSDFVVAKKEGVQKATDKVNLSFSHKLSQVVFQLKNGDGFTLKQLQGAEIKIKNAITDARYNLSAGNYALPEVGDTRADVIPYGRWTVNDAQDRLIGVKAIVMPQELNAANSIEIMLGDRIFVKKFSSPVVLNSGESRVFTITLNNNGGSMPEGDSDADISTELKPWESGIPVEDDAEEVVSDTVILTAVIPSDRAWYLIVTRTDDIVVDWGDGCRDTNIFTHQYIDNISHTIKFYGSNKALTGFQCVGSGLTVLNVSNNVALDFLSCGANSLKTLDISNNTKLKQFECGYNQLTTLDITNNLELETLGVCGNPLGTLDVTKHLKLTSLICGVANLTNLDISNNIYLTNLDCQNNDLTTLNIDNQPDLSSLYCCGNRIESLNLSNNKDIFAVICHNNSFIENNPKLIEFANSLPDRTGKETGVLQIVSREAAGSAPETVIRSIIESKNWRFDYWL